MLVASDNYGICDMLGVAADTRERTETPAYWKAGFRRAVVAAWDKVGITGTSGTLIRVGVGRLKLIIFTHTNKARSD